MAENNVGSFGARHLRMVGLFGVQVCRKECANCATCFAILATVTYSPCAVAVDGQYEFRIYHNIQMIASKCQGHSPTAEQNTHNFGQISHDI